MVPGKEAVILVNVHPPGPGPGSLPAGGGGPPGDGDAVAPGSGWGPAGGEEGTPARIVWEYADAERREAEEEERDGHQGELSDTESTDGGATALDTDGVSMLQCWSLGGSLGVVQGRCA